MTMTEDAGGSDTPPVATFVGCDAGTTASCAILVTENGDVLETAFGAGANPGAIGMEKSVETAAGLIRRVFRINSEAPAVVTVALSGAWSPTLFSKYAEILRRAIQVPDETRVLVSTDAIAPLGLIIPTSLTLGVILPAPGTGAEKRNGPPRLAVVLASSESVAAVCSIRNRSTLSFRSSVENCILTGDKFSYFADKKVGGWGSVLGDASSAYGIASKALNMALRIREGRMPVVVKKVQGPCAVTVHRDTESKSLAVSVLYAALSHFAIRADDFEDGIATLGAYISEGQTKRVEIATFAPILASLAASGHGLCKQVFSEAGCALGELLSNCLSSENDKTGIFNASRTAVCVVGEMFNSWREVPDFANAFRGSMAFFLANGGQIFILKSAVDSPVMLSQKSDELAYGCARAGAIACSNVSEEWAATALSHFHRISGVSPGI